MNFFSSLSNKIAARKTRKFSVRRLYFGIEDMCFHGGVFAENAPEARFHVGLIDSTGEVVISTIANKKSLKAKIPDGYGFSLPVPYEWLGPSDTPRLFQFKILETEEVFPKVPREIPAKKLLRDLERNTESGTALRARLKRLTREIAEVAGEKALVVGTHDMTRTGAPMIILEIIKHLKLRHDCDIILLCLGTRETLFQDFDKHCLIIVENLEQAFKTALPETEELFVSLGENAGRQTALINSLCSTRIAEACYQVGLDVRSLIHEYPHAFEPEWVLRHFSATNGVVFPCQDVYQSYISQDLTTSSEDQTDSIFLILPQGCYHLEYEPLDEKDARDFVSTFRDENNLGPNDRLIVSCGTIDSRKGFDWFATLIRHYKNNSPNAETTHFLWIGKVGEEELFFHALHDLRQENLIGHFHHLDEMKDVRLALCMADVFLLCSRIDPFPSVVLESFLMGIPVIGFDKGQGSSGMIRETGFGTIIPYCNLAEATQAIDDLIENSHTRQKVKDLGPAFVSNNFSYRRYVDTLAKWLFEHAPPNELKLNLASYSKAPLQNSLIQPRQLIRTFTLPAAFQPEITIGIPAYNTGKKIVNTLHSLQNQSFEKIQVLVAIESTPEAEETLVEVSKFTECDPRFSAVVNTEVLGWAENIRQLQMKVNTPYFMILPHDDALHPECLEHLHQTIESHPEASIAFPHIYFVGNADGLQLPTEHTTELFERMHDHFVDGGNPEFWKALTRTSVLKNGCSFPSYGLKSFSAEYEWAAILLSQGTTIANPRAICYKQIHAPDDESVSNEWIYKATESERSTRFIEHELRMKALISRLSVNENQLSPLLEAYQAAHWWRMLEFGVDRYPLSPAIREQIAKQECLDPSTQRRFRLCELRCRWIENRIDDVMEELLLLIDSAPLNHDAQILLIKCQLRHGDIDNAVLQMNRLEQLFPNSWRHREVAAWLASELKQKYALNNTP